MTSSSRIIQFGAFQLDRRSGELTRSGKRVHLAPQATQVLDLLTRRAGEIVTREEIRTTLWTEDTFVDFDTAVNACISQIRAVLVDKATAPRFVETLPRRGYRFVAPIVIADAEPLMATPAAPTVVPDLEYAATPVMPPGSLSRQWQALAAVLVVAISGLVAAVLSTRTQPAGAAAAYDSRTRSLTAIQKFERGSTGLADASPTELLARVKHFETAIAAEPGFAEAYAGLAEARLLAALYRAESPSIAYAGAKAAAAKALSLKPDLGPAHATYAAAVLQFEWDWETARAHFSRAETLAPASARVHHWYSRYFTARGRHQDALRHADRALELAPTSPSAWTNAGVASFYAGNLGDARRRCDRAVMLMPAFVPAVRCSAAVSEVADGRGASSPDGVLLPAITLAHGGNRDGALEWLQLAANRHSDGLIFASVQPAFTALHSDPRFIGILQRVGLSPLPVR
ncbi:MAG: winged helix-turn-helix domain-containing protein [Vicinamibacterales bacterium]